MVWKENSKTAPTRRRPTCNLDTWGTQIHLPGLRPGHPPVQPSVLHLKLIALDISFVPLNHHSITLENILRPSRLGTNPQESFMSIAQGRRPCRQSMANKKRTRRVILMVPI